MTTKNQAGIDLVEHEYREHERWREIAERKYGGENMSEEQHDDGAVLATGWDATKNAVEKATAGRFLKWEDGETKFVCVCGVPKMLEREFQGELRKRVQINCMLTDDDRLKTWEMSPTTWRLVLEERDLCKGEFAAAVYRVKRSGTGKATEYRLRYERQLTPDELRARDAAMGDVVPF